MTFAPTLAGSPKDDGEVTGFISLAWSTPETAEVAWMAVHPGFRCAGRGTLLLEAAATFARDHGARMLMLFTSPVADLPGVDDGFEATRRFYAANGFISLWTVKPQGRREPHLLMARAL